MESIFTKPKLRFVPLVLLVILLGVFKGQAQTQVPKERVYASSIESEVRVANSSNAVDADVSTYATLEVPLDLLGLLSAHIQPKFDTEVAAGTPLFLKLGVNSGVLGVADNVVIQAYSGGAPVGEAQSLTALLNLLNGEYQEEVVFIPQTSEGVYLAYDAVRVTLQSALALGLSMDVFEAYYMQDASGVACDEPVDVLYGSTSGALGGVNVVNNPDNVVDGDYTSFTEIRANVDVAGKTFVKTVYNAASVQGDSIRVVFENYGGGLLEASLLASSFGVKTYLDKQDNGTLDLDENLLSLSLLPGSSSIQVLTYPIDVPFNRIEVFLGDGLATALDGIYVYEMERVAQGPEIIAPDINDGLVSVCAGEEVTLSINNPDPGSTYRWYTSLESAAPIHTGESFTPSSLGAGTHKFFAAQVRNGCTDESGRAMVAVEVKDTPTAEDTEVSGNENPFCSGDEVVLTPSVSVGSTLVTSDPATFNWYLDTDGTQPIMNGDTDGTISYSIDANGVLTVTGLENSGSPFIYYLAVVGDNGCENMFGDLEAVQVTVNRNATDDDIELSNEITQCLGSPVELNPDSNISNAVFSWFLDEAMTQGISDGDTDGSIAYSIDAEGTLIITGLEEGEIATYYVTVQGDDVCENLTPKSIQVSISDDLPAPTLNATDVDVCGEGGSAIVEVTNSSGSMSYAVYDAVSGGNEVTTDITIENNLITFSNVTGGPLNYWIGVSGDGGCEGSERTGVTLTVIEEAIADDIVADDEIICEGESAILQASSPNATNPVFRWYMDEGLTDFISEGASLEVSPALTTTYYVTVYGDGLCENVPGTAHEVNVTVNETPDVPGVSEDVTITEGFGTLLTASLGDPAPDNVEIVWYDGNGNELATGGQYSTGVLSLGTYTYYVGSRNTATGCEAESRSQVTVYVVPAGSTGECTVANAQTNGTYAVCLLCGVEDPQNAVDGNIETYSRFVAPAAVTGGVYQDLIFQQGGSAGDVIVLTLGTSGTSLLDAGILSGLKVESYLGDAGNGDGGTLDDDVTIDIGLLDLDEDKGEVRFVAGGDFDRVKVEYRPLLGALENGWRIYQAEVEFQRPSAITEDMEVCVGETATLEATAAPGTMLRWYDAEQGGALLEEGNQFITEVQEAAGTVTYYIAVVRNGCEDPERIPVDLLVKESPTAADIEVSGNENPVCEADEIVLTPSITDGSILVTGTPTFNWYLDEEKNQPITDGDVSGGISYAVDANGILTISGLAFADSPYTYYVAVVGDNGCENPAGELEEVLVEVNRTADDGDIDLDSNITQCVGVPVELSPSSSITNAVFNWYLDENKTTPINDGDVDGDITYTLDGAGKLIIEGLDDGSTVSYYVTVNGDGVCENALGKAITVNVDNNLPAPTFKTTDVDICGVGGNAVFELTNNAGGRTYTVYTSEDGMEEVGDVTVDGNLITIGNVAASATYWVGVTGDGGCIGTDRTSVSLTVLPVATADDVEVSDVTICEGESTVLEASSQDVTNPIFRWYEDEDLTVLLFEGASYEVSPVATTTYYLTVEGEGICENVPGESKAVTVSVNGLPDTPLVSEDVTITEGYGTLLVASSGNPEPENVEVVWYDQVGNEIATGNEYNTGVLSKGTYTYYAGTRNTLSGCESDDRSEVIVTVLAAGPVEDCTVANIQRNATVFPCVLCGIENPENAVDGNIDTYARILIPLSALGGGVEQELIFPQGGSAGDTISVTIGTGGSIVDASILAGIHIETYNGATANGDGGSLNEDDIRVRLVDVGEEEKGTIKFATGSDYDRVRITYSADVLSALDSRFRVYQAQVEFQEPIILTEDVEVCAGDVAELEATPQGGTVLRWYDAETGGTLLAEGNGFTSPVLTEAGTVTYYIAIVREECESADRIPIEVIVKAGPTAADIEVTGNEMPVCADEPVVLSPSVAAGSTLVTTTGTFSWYLDADRTMPISDGDVDGAVSYGINAEGVLTINGLDAVDSPYIYYVSVIGDNGCENAPGELKAVEVAINRNANDTDINLADEVTQCVGLPVTLTPSSGIGNPVFNWYYDAAKANPINDGDTDGSVTFNINSSGQLTITGLGDGSNELYYVTVFGDGVCENVTGKAVNVLVSNSLPKPTFVSTDLTICGAGEAVFEVTNYAGGMTYTLYDAETGGNEIISGVFQDENIITLSDVSEDVTYWVEVTGAAGCIGTDRTRISVTVNRNATAADIDADGGTICEGESFTLSASSSIGNPVFTWYTDASLTTVLADTEVMPSATTTYYVTVSGDGVCENQPGDAKEVTVTVNDLAAPTTNSIEQAFCQNMGATLSDLQVNESNIIWYDSPVGGNSLSESTELVQGATYYAATVNPGTGCESKERLAIKVAECAGLEVEKVASVTEAVVGEMFDYTITVTNNGVATATNLEVIDIVPAALQVISGSDEAIIDGNTVTWQIAELASGESIVLTINVMALEENAGVVNRVEVTGDNSPPDDDETDPVPVSPNDVDLSIELAVSDPAVEVGREFSYQLTITNKTDVQANNVIVTDYLPEGVQYIGNDASGDIQVDYDANTGEVVFTIPEMEGNQELIITISVRATQSGLMTNSVQVETPDQEDSFEGDNSDSISHNQLSITVPNVFTPNGDGVNDTWEIEGLTELYPDNEVIVVNRWGGEVFKSVNYQNDWDGGSLNEGTYYYKLKIRDPESGNEMQFTGYVTILR